ncbi:hypothetical protein GCM10020220_086290 [Nonomuraea rubra]
MSGGAAGGGVVGGAVGWCLRPCAHRERTELRPARAAQTSHGSLENHNIDVAAAINAKISPAPTNHCQTSCCSVR